MPAINTNVESSLLKFRFTDTDNEIIASFSMNPADVKLAKRCQDVAAFFETLDKKFPENATLDDAMKLNDTIEEKFCEVLGYDVKSSLFGRCSATSIMADGRMFCIHVLEVINQAVEPEIRKRAGKMKTALEKHTAKYS